MDDLEQQIVQQNNLNQNVYHLYDNNNNFSIIDLGIVLIIVIVIIIIIKLINRFK